MLGPRRAPARAAFRFLDPSPEAPAAGGRRARRRRLRRSRGPRAPRRRRRRRHLRVRERPGRGGARGRRRCRRRSRSSWGRTAWSRSSSSSGSGSRPRASARSRRPGLPALVKSRRLGYDGKGQRRLDAARGARGADELAEEIVAVRPRALDHRRPRPRRRDPLLAARRERAPRRDPARLARAGRSCAAGRAPRRSSAGCSTSSATSACSRSSCSRSDGRLLANEFAPRVHNTGHWTIDGAVTSQFENHLRAILGLPLGATEALAPSVMINLIGGAPAPEALLRLPGAHLHLYGKEPRRGRKIGHVTLVGATEDGSPRRSPSSTRRRTARSSAVTVAGAAVDDAPHEGQRRRRFVSSSRFAAGRDHRPADGGRATTR